MKKNLRAIMVCALLLVSMGAKVFANLESVISVPFDFEIASKNIGYTSAFVEKTGSAEAAYADVDTNSEQIFWFVRAARYTAFIVVDATGTRISDEEVLHGAGDAYPSYYPSYQNYVGFVALRANCAEENLSSPYDCEGTFYATAP